MRFHLLLHLLATICHLTLACLDGNATATSRSSRPSCGLSSHPHQLLRHRGRHRHRHHHLKLVGERDAEPGEFPYQVYLASDAAKSGPGVGNRCGGVIIDEHHILTAAHCLAERNSSAAAKSVVAFVGVHDMEHEEYSEIPVEAFIVHNKWDHEDAANEGMDVAVLRTRKPMEFKLLSEGFGSVDSICLPKPNENLAPIGSIVTLTGNGLVRDNEQARVLQTQEVRVDRYMNGCDKSKRDNVCLATLADSNSEACIGVSGGPAAVEKDGRWYLVGLTSRGRGVCDGSTCYCQHGQPTIFTRISNLVSWIRDTKSELANRRSSRRNKLMFRLS